MYIGSDASGNGYGIFLNSESESSGQIDYLVGGRAWYNTGAYITDSNWHHIVAVLTSSTHVKIYLDNSLIYDADILEANTPTTQTTIGWEDYPSVARHFYGLIDEINIFSRVLSSSEISTLYNSGLGLYGDINTAPFNSGLVAGYHFDEGSGTSAIDFSGNNNTGTLTTDQFYSDGLVQQAGEGVSVNSGILTIDGDYNVITFNSSGVFTVQNATSVEVLVVAGGGGEEHT
jgi:hypothetical protein